MFKNITKNFLSLIIAQAVYKVLSFLTIVYITRKIGDAGFGKISLALYFGTIFLALADMGLSEFFVLDSAGERIINPKKIGINIGTRIFLNIAVCFIIIFCAFIFANEPPLIITIILIGISALLDSFTLFLRSIFRSIEKMHYEAISFILEGIIKFGIIVILVNLLNASFEILGAAFLITSIITLLFTMFICKEKLCIVPIVNFKTCIGYIKKGMPFAIIGFLCVINLKIDVIMLSKLSNDYATGWYSAAVRLVESLLIIPAVLAIALFPVLSRLRKYFLNSFVYLYRSAFGICIMAGLTISILLYYSSAFLIRFIFGQVFINSIEVLKILSWIFVPFFLKFFLERVAMVLNRANVLFIAYTGGAILKIMLNFIIMPRWSYRGIGFTSVLTEALIIIYILFSVRKDARLFYTKPLQKDFAIEGIDESKISAI